MNNHQKFCESLGNKSYTRLEYDDTDRAMREAMRKAMQDYKQTSEEKSNEIKKMRAEAFTQQRSDLKKLAKFVDCK